MKASASWFRTLAIFTACSAIYLTIGRRVVGPAAMLENVPFDADVFRVVGDLTKPEFGHYRTSAHPLFVLLLLPPGRALAAFTGDNYEGARCLTALVAAAAVALFERILRRIVRGPGELPWLLTLLYGASASTLVFAAVPETFMFGALSILPTYGLVAAGVTRLSAWSAAMLAAFAVTSTNVCQALAGYWYAIRSRPRSWWPAWVLLATALVALNLSLLQTRVFPSSEPIWKVAEEKYYSHPGALIAPGRWLRTAKGVFLDAVVGPEVQVVEGRLVTGRRPAHGAGGLVTAALWLGLLGCAVRGAIRRRKEAPPLVPVVALGLGFNLLLHLVYGSPQVFLYSPHWTFLLILIVAMGWPERPGPWLRAGIATVTLAVILHNAWFFVRFVEALERVAAERC